MKFAILIPTYKDSSLLLNNLPKLFEYLKSLNDVETSIYVINDGDPNICSFDEYKEKITLFNYSKNMGKGYAIKYGIFNIGKCDYVLFMDSDFATDLDSIKKSIEHIRDNDIVIANRYLKDSKFVTKRKRRRIIVSKLGSFLIRGLFNMRYKDTQCGFKCFKYDIAYKLANLQKENRFAFDIEYLYIAKLNNLKVNEIPVCWNEKDTSSVRLFSDSIKTLISLIKIRFRKKEYIFK